MKKLNTSRRPHRFLRLLSLIMLLPGIAMAYVDPTRPPGYDQTPTNTSSVSSLTLSAVFISQNLRLAIINNLPLKLGDKIGQFTVTTIDINAVELVGPQDSRQTLLLSPVVKTVSDR